MCGLCGLIGPAVQTNDLKALRQLAYICALRGSDSTGFMTARSGKFGEIRIYKDAVPSSYALWNDHKQKRPLLETIMPTVFMVHCRDATVGRITSENAHPFRAGDLIGMHNGTLKDVKYLGKGKTDSESLIIDMANRGVETVLEELDPYSAFALSLYDKKKEIVYFARSKRRPRPLFFAVHPKRRVLFYASEKEMLELVLKRNDILHTIIEADPEVLYSINPNDVDAGDSLPFDVTPLKLQEPEINLEFDWGNWERWADGGDNPPWDDIPTVKAKESKTDDKPFGESEIPKFLKKDTEVFKGCLFCRSVLTQSEIHHCEELADDVSLEPEYMCTDCRMVYDGVSVESKKISAM